MKAQTFDPILNQMIDELHARVKALYPSFVEILKSGDIYIGGHFGYYSGTSQAKLSRWDTSKEAWFMIE